MRNCIIIILGLLIYHGLVHQGSEAREGGSGDVIERVGEGEVNWSDMVIRSRGLRRLDPQIPNPMMARVRAMEFARAAAVQNTGLSIKGLRLNPRTTVGDLMFMNNGLRAMVEKILGSAILKEIRYSPDDGIEVTIGVDLRGLVKSALFPDLGVKGNEIGPGEVRYTGLVVDTPGLSHGLPALSPNIYDENGSLVYGASFVSRKFAERWGIAGYYMDLRDAMSDERVGNNPLILKAIGFAGEVKTDPVISDQDAERLKEPGLDLGFLREGRVIIVLPMVGKDK